MSKHTTLNRDGSVFLAPDDALALAKFFEHAGAVGALDMLESHIIATDVENKLEEKEAMRKAVAIFKRAAPVAQRLTLLNFRPEPTEKQKAHRADFLRLVEFGRTL